jgi:hypothetical protein
VGAAALNVVSRRLLGAQLERTIFHDARAAPPMARRDGYAWNGVALTPGNLRRALLASGSIPLVMAGQSGIDGAPGVHRDGGLVDYHFDVPFDAQGGLVLLPHFSPRVVPGWFDKGLAWRRASHDRLADTLVLSPSPAFVAALPGAKIPDRNDFYAYLHRDDERLAAWRRVIDASKALADAFADDVAHGRIGALAQPLR